MVVYRVSHSVFHCVGFVIARSTRGYVSDVTNTRTLPGGTPNGTEAITYRREHVIDAANNTSQSKEEQTLTERNTHGLTSL